MLKSLILYLVARHCNTQCRIRPNRASCNPINLTLCNQDNPNILFSYVLRYLPKPRLVGHKTCFPIEP